MKIKVIGKAHLKGHSERTGKDYDFLQFHYIGHDPNVEGEAALTVSVDPGLIDFEGVKVGSLYELDYGPRGRGIGVVGMRLA